MRPAPNCSWRSVRSRPPPSTSLTPPISTGVTRDRGVYRALVGRGDTLGALAGDLGWLIERACDAAHFWHLDPLSVMAMPIDDLLLLHAQAARLGVQQGE